MSYNSTSEVPTETPDITTITKTINNNNYVALSSVKIVINMFILLLSYITVIL